MIPSTKTLEVVATVSETTKYSIPERRLGLLAALMQTLENDNLDEIEVLEQAMAKVQTRGL